MGKDGCSTAASTHPCKLFTSQISSSSQPMQALHLADGFLVARPSILQGSSTRDR